MSSYNKVPPWACAKRPGQGVPFFFAPVNTLSLLPSNSLSNKYF